MAVAAARAGLIAAARGVPAGCAAGLFAAEAVGVPEAAARGVASAAAGRVNSRRELWIPPTAELTAKNGTPKNTPTPPPAPRTPMSSLPGAENTWATM
jgi:hypothetical protein